MEQIHQVYADYAAATPTDPQVVTAMAPFFGEVFGNPSSVHSFGQAAAEAIKSSKQTLAKFLNCQRDEVFFTGSGTESNNLALIGVAKANRSRGNHIITLTTEHPSILNTCRALERDGFEVTYLGVNQEGLVDSQELIAAVKPTTILLSIALANSEIGIIQNINELSKAAKQKLPSIYFHTDACQAAPYIDLDVSRLGVDLLTLNGSKMYGPKGMGLLYVREGVEIFPIIFGGGQQQSLRSGTENVPGIVGLAKAAEIISQNRQTEFKRIEKLRDDLRQKLAQLPGAIINAENAPRLPNHLSVILTKTNMTDLVGECNKKGVAVSAGSACSSSSLGQSHVLQALGRTSHEINRTLRLSFGYQTTKADCRKLLSVLGGLA